MIEALRQLFSSKKFYTTVAGVATAIAARYGFNLDPELVMGILGIFAILVGAQGAADFGKEGARLRQKGSSTLACLGIVLFTSGSVVACSWVSSTASKAKADVIDCTKPEIAPYVDLLTPVLIQAIHDEVASTSSVDLSKLTNLIRSFTLDVGGCILSKIILSPTPSTLALQPSIDVRASFAKSRHALFGDATFHTALGDV